MAARLFASRFGHYSARSASSSNIALISPVLEQSPALKETTAYCHTPHPPPLPQPKQTRHRASPLHSTAMHRRAVSAPPAVRRLSSSERLRTVAQVDCADDLLQEHLQLPGQVDEDSSHTVRRFSDDDYDSNNNGSNDNNDYKSNHDTEPPRVSMPNGRSVRPPLALPVDAKGVAQGTGQVTAPIIQANVLSTGKAPELDTSVSSERSTCVSDSTAIFSFLHPSFEQQKKRPSQDLKYRLSFANTPRVADQESVAPTAPRIAELVRRNTAFTGSPEEMMEAMKAEAGAITARFIDLHGERCINIKSDIRDAILRSYHPDLPARYVSALPSVTHLFFLVCCVSNCFLLCFVFVSSCFFLSLPLSRFVYGSVCVCVCVPERLQCVALTETTLFVRAVRSQSSYVRRRTQRDLPTDAE